MAAIELKIRDKKDKEKISKTYEADGYDLMLGTIDDFFEIIDIDKLDDEKAVGLMIIKAYPQIKAILRDVFPELTDAEYRCVKVNDLITTIMQIGASALENIGFMTDEKN